MRSVRTGATTLTLMILGATLCRADDFVDSVDKSWRERGKQVSAVRVNWRATTTFVAGGLTTEVKMFALPKSELAAKVRAGAQFPEHDVPVQTNHALLIVNGSARYDYETAMWSLETEPKNYIKPRRALCLDGNTKTFDPSGLGVGSTPTGILVGDKYLVDLLEPQARPLVVHCLPYSEGYDKYAIHKLGAITTKSLNGGLIELTCQPPDINEVIKLTCDRSRADVITSIQHVDKKSGKRKLFFAVEYQRDPVLGVFPTRWEAIQYAVGQPGKETKRISATVDSYEVNSQLNKSDLEFEFEKGTIVIGSGRTGKQIIGDGGTAYDLTTEDMGRPYSELRELVDRKRNRWRPVAFFVIAALILVFGGLCLKTAKRPQRRRNLTTPGASAATEDSA